jgi:RNA polymerase sigma-70 factor (ECF subfamily)
MDREAEFRRLYQAHRVAVHAYFTGRTGGPKLAADLSVDTYRHWHTQAAAEQALAHEPDRPPPPASAAVIATERLAVVGEAIGRLPEPQRVTLTMAATGELTSAEIATALGVPAGTVRYRLSLARRALAEALGHYDHPGEEQ